MSSEHSDERDHEARLRLLAGAVADYEAVDWGAVESSATEADQPLIKILKVISGVARTHQRDHWADDESTADVVEPAVYVVRESWGPLQIIERVGAGMFGEVYRARDPQLDREVALKLFYADRLGRARPAQVLIEEGRLLARVRHPNVAVVHGAEENDDRVGIWMEFVEGKTLERYVGENGPLDPPEAMAIGRDVCRALAALHDAEVVHRDIKASNVMREEGGRVVLLDLGASRDASSLDSDGLYGTPYYAAPEVLIRNESSPASDVYSVGVLLFSMVTGQYPVEGETVRELREAHAAGQVKSLKEIRPDLPVALSRVVARALMPEPDARFASAHEFEEALTDALEVKARARRRRARLLTLVAALALAVGAWIWGRGEAQLSEIVPDRIAIAPLVNRTGDPANDLVGMLAADAVVRRFAETGEAETIVTSLAAENAQDGGAEEARSVPEDRLVEAARQKGAAFLLSGACYLEGGALNLQARLTDTANGESVYTFDTDNDDPEAETAGVEALAEKVVAGVAAHLDPYLDISVLRPPASYEVYQLWLRGQEHPEDLISFYGRALEIDPKSHIMRFFQLDYILNRWDLECDYESRILAEEICSVAEQYLDEFTPFERAYYRYQVARCAGDRVATLNQARQMSRLAPDLWWPPMFLAFRAAIVNRPHEAVDVLTSAYASYTPEPNMTQDFMYLHALAANVHLIGDYEAQNDYADQGLDLYPDVETFYASKAAAFAALDRVDDMEQVVDDMLRYTGRGGYYTPGQVMLKVSNEARYHGQPEAAARLAARAVEWYERQIAESGREALNHDNRWTHAYALRMTGRLQEAREILVGLKETGWRAIEVEGSLGVLAAIIGDRDEAQRVAERFGDTSNRYTADRHLYWRACIAAHLGEKDLAVTLLGEAFARGLSYDTLHRPGHDRGGWHLHSDEDLEPLWHYPAFERLIEPQG